LHTISYITKLEPFGGFKLKAVPLKFIKKLQDIVLKEAESIGSSAVFECEVSPSTAVTSWMKDGGNLRESPKHKFISDGKDRKLHIIDVQLSDTGEYTCVAKNAGKEISCTAKLIQVIAFKLPVKWMKELDEETSTIKGQHTYLTCELSKEKDVIWKKNNEVLKKKDGKVQITIIGLQHAVTIQNTNEDDAGTYTCEVDGQEDVKTSTNVLIHHLPQITAENNAGKPIVMAIPYTAYPKAEAEWLYNNQSLPTDSIYTSADCTEYRLKDPKKSDEGRYKVLIKNKHGGGEAFINLDVIGKCCAVKPTAVLQETWLPAIMRGIPVPTAKWSIEGEEITSEGNIKIDTDNFSTILSINECTRTHTGTYLLTVSNAAGSKTVGLNVTVLDVPAAPIGPVNILEVTPDSMTIEWRPPKEDGGSPITNYIVDKRESNKETWGGVSSGSLGTELKITRLQRGAEYVVRIRAENKMGVGAPLESKPTVAEHSFMPPSPPGKPQSYDLSEDSVTVGWTMPLADGGSQITGYLIERRHKGGKWIRVNRIPCKDLRYRVLGLFEGNEYEFRVFAENIAGYSGPSPISDPCKPCRPITVPRPPINPKIKDYSKTTADLVWTKPSKDGGSPILGYTVEMRKGDAEEWKKVNLDDFIKLCAYQVKGLEEGVAYKFRVYASNMVGDGEAKEIPDSIVAQDILIPPEIEMDAACRERVTVRVGHNINITGYIKARPDAEVIWSKEETVLENSKRVTITQNFPVVHLKIKEATRADHGKYTLKASNEGGEASCTIVVNVLDRPSHCQNLHTTYVTKDSCMINWDVPLDNGGSEITHYIVECREPSISMWSMISSNCTNRKIKAKLMEGHEYFFRVCAANKIGPGPSVETKTPTLAVDCIEKPGEPENFRATEIGKNFVYLRWRRPDYDGGSPNLHYNIESKTKDAEEWQKLNTSPLTDTFFLADKCVENQTYTFRLVIERLH
uniref:Titin n=1 Tax=Oryzias sinensis TaxID=183150 RepID=A0A8C7YJ26_9TELE